MKNLTVLTRMDAVFHTPADATRFVAVTRERLRPFDLRFVICTMPGDPIESVADTSSGVAVVTANIKRFDEPVNTLLEAARDQGATRLANPDALLVSPNITITAEQLAVAMVRIHREGLYWYGWQVEGMLNDGTRPGKLNYNACTLYRGWLLHKHAGTVPEYVNNGVLGELEFEWQGEAKRGPAGGGEETVQMCQVIESGYEVTDYGRRDPYEPKAKLFGFDTTVLPSTAKTSTGGIGFNWKIARKVPMALEYLKRFKMTEAAFMAHVQIYS